MVMVGSWCHQPQGNRAALMSAAERGRCLVLPGLGLAFFLFLARGSAGDRDGVADHIGGAFPVLARSASFIPCHVGEGAHLTLGDSEGPPTFKLDQIRLRDAIPPCLFHELVRVSERIRSGRKGVPLLHPRVLVQS